MGSQRTYTKVIPGCLMVRWLRPRSMQRDMHKSSGRRGGGTIYMCVGFSRDQTGFPFPVLLSPSGLITLTMNDINDFEALET